MSDDRLPLLGARTHFAAGERSLRWVADRPHRTIDVPLELLADVDTPADARAFGIALEAPQSDS